MKLFFYEFRKTFLRTYVVVLLIVLSFLDLVKIGVDYYQGNIDLLVTYDSEEKDAFQYLYTKMKGTFEEESYQFLCSEEERLGEIFYKGLNQYNPDEVTYSGNLYEDYIVLEKFIGFEYHYMREYSDSCNAFVAAAEENIAYYQDRGNSLKMQENAFVAENYSNRSISQFYRTGPISQYIEYRFSSILAVFLCFLGVAPVFGAEYDCKMYEVLSVSRNGRMRSAVIKIFASLIFAALVVLWFSLLDWLAYRILFSFEGLDNPIWAIEEFEQSFLNCTIANFIVHEFFLKLLAFCGIAVVLLLISLLIKKIVYVAGVFALAAAYWYVTSGWLNSFSEWKVWLSLWNPIRLLKSYELYQSFQYLEVGNHFVLKSTMCIWGNVGLIVIGLALILAARKRQKS